MTKIEIHYVNGEGVVYPTKKFYDDAYYLKDNYIQFDVASIKHAPDEYKMIVPFNNVASIKIWEESDKVNESKNK